MGTRTIPPLHEWKRRHPAARRIASQVPAELAALSFTMLRDDIRARYPVGRSIASIAASLVKSRRCAA